MMAKTRKMKKNLQIQTEDEKMNDKRNIKTKFKNEIKKNYFVCIYCVYFVRVYTVYAGYSDTVCGAKYRPPPVDGGIIFFLKKKLNSIRSNSIQFNSIQFNSIEIILRPPVKLYFFVNILCPLAKLYFLFLILPATSWQKNVF